MSPEHRDALLSLAAQHGQKDLSLLVAAAIDQFLENERTRGNGLDSFLSLAGSLAPEEADELRAVTTNLRSSWR